MASPSSLLRPQDFHAHRERDVQVSTTVHSSVDELLGLLKNPKRRRIIAALGGRPACVGELTRLLGYDMPSVSLALGRLAAVGLVKAESVKKMRVYTLTDLVQVHRSGTSLRLIVQAREGAKVDVEYELSAFAAARMDSIDPTSRS